MIANVLHSKSKMTVLAMLVLVTVVFTSCGNAPDLSRLQEDSYYVAQDNDRSVVFKVEEVTERSFKGRWYVEDGHPAQPHCFEAVAERPHLKEMRSDSLIVKANAVSHDGNVRISLLLDGSWQTLTFNPWQQPSVMTLNQSCPYYDSLYDVTCTKDVPYACAKGYWASYPEPANGSDAILPILLDKMNVEDLTQKDCELTMDIYTPVTNVQTKRPLLMLIHGGAFFNGDKEAAGYKEWGNYFASRGYIVASINYRLGFIPLGRKYVDRAGYRAVQDAHAAMCYLLRHPELYPIDTNYLFVGGSSAGGITALNLAFMRDEDRPDCTKAGKVNKVSHVYNLLTDDIDILDYRKRKDIGCKDLGEISAVAEQSGGDVDFKVNAVVNMWGAVHKIDMIDSTNNTAILSFHGDADSVVAYGYDYPFTKVNNLFRDFIRKVREPFKYSRSQFAQTVDDFLCDAEDLVKPVNQALCNKMYGSKCIHERALSKGMLSELHTKAGGGHSLHVNDDGSLSLYYTYISEVTKRFLYLRMFPQPTLNTSHAGQQQWFELENAGGLQTCGWEAEGGLVLQTEPYKARVIFFADADEHKLHITGKEKNGQNYNETYYY